MLNFLKRLLKDASDNFGNSVKILYPVGILFEDKSGQYFIDGESLEGPTYDYVIYADNIRNYDETNPNELSPQKKLQVLDATVSLLEAKGYKLDINRG